MDYKINVTRSSMPDYREYCEEIKDIWDSRWLTNSGVKHLRLENDLKEYLGTPNIVLYTNGHMALEQAVALYDFPAGSEVITTPFTFVSTTNAIVRNGLVPVFCDVSPKDYTIDVTKIEGLITHKTCAIMPVHVYGNLCDVEEIDRIAKKHGLKVIYDAAHAFGVKYNGVQSANFGDISMFSFHATKVFNTIEGGALCFRDESSAKILNERKNFGLSGADECAYTGTNAKMNEFQAAMGICNLRHLDGEIEKRRHAVMRYRAALENAKGIKLCSPQPGVTSNYAYFPVVFDGYRQNRDEIFEKLAAENITARKYFYPLTSDFICYKNRGFKGTGATPVAKEIADKVLCLPVFADIRPEDVDRICSIILK